MWMVLQRLYVLWLTLVRRGYACVQYKLRIKFVLKIARPDEDNFADVFHSFGNHRVSLLCIRKVVQCDV
ncbi:hypothetical protein PsorP6_017802 [Peronosclerospora sorghi]|uniref:Uncharacterized protein n=1 Tax=Peronosclerospora sorghi TaxID=230839 RepID=A0ACC0WFM3_9STRA|nr:hypothetical protein PsorP6_017802 [Peronosclerospora sorghi]